MVKEVTVGPLHIGRENPLVLIAGPCVIEDEDTMFETARRLKEVCASLSVPLIFKSSYDKANRTSLSSYRGPGLEKGLRILSEVKSRYALPVLSDVHSTEEARIAADVLDILQVPAFLCRQTDLILAVSQTGKPANIKKGQFLSPWEMKHVIEKFVSTGNQNLLVTERGTSFGHHNLIVDFRGFPVMRSFGYPVVFDVTHGLQLPGEQGSSSGGQREFAAPLARAAAAAGIDGLFTEVHSDPERALSDATTMIPLDRIEKLIRQASAIHDLVRIQEPGQ